MSDVWIVLIGVGAGWVLSVLTPAATHRLARRRRRRALALLVCPALDRFVADCQATIDDDGKQHTSGIWHFNAPMPTGPEFPTGGDWTAVDPKLANRILSLPLATIRAAQELSYIREHTNAPENEEAFAFRRKLCFILQHEALELSDTLRKRAGLPPASDDLFDNIWG